MTTIVYSTTRVPAALRPEGARYVNPAFFDKPEPGATLVYLNGDFPKVRAAYERAGVPVADLRARTAPVVTLAAPDGGAGVLNLATQSYLKALTEATSPRNPADVIGEQFDAASIDYDRDTLAGMRRHCAEVVGGHDALPDLEDLPEAEQAEVEAVLNDDTPFVDQWPASGLPWSDEPGAS